MEARSHFTTETQSRFTTEITEFTERMFHASQRPLPLATY